MRDDILVRAAIDRDIYFLAADGRPFSASYHLERSLIVQRDSLLTLPTGRQVLLLSDDTIGKWCYNRPCWRKQRSLSM